MPGFESIIDQKRPIRILTTCLRDGNIPHALLFTGISGIGKRTTARLFSKACNCEALASGVSRKRLDGIPCCRCRSCRKIKSGNHPDIIHIKPSGNIIKIAQIRNLCHTLSMKPYDVKYGKSAPDHCFALSGDPIRSHFQKKSHEAASQ